MTQRRPITTTDDNDDGLTDDLEKHTSRLSNIHDERDYKEFRQFIHNAWWFYMFIHAIVGVIVCYFMFVANYLHTGWLDRSTYETLLALIWFVWAVILFTIIQFRNNWQIMYVIQMFGTGTVAMGFAIIHLKLFVCPTFAN
jgi:hypothetical protein